MGNVFNIQRFSLHDGPGIRTTFFLMGCPLRCVWCHNPEGMEERIQLQYSEKECIQCGACVAACPQAVHEIKAAEHQVFFDRCKLCQNCIKVCPTEALQLSGKAYTVEELVSLGIRDVPFYKNQGGITFSGGEPLLQPRFVAEIAKQSKAHGVPTVAIDTAGDVEWGAFEKVLPYVDYFLFDLKAASEEVHIFGTGCSNKRILENLFRLDKTGKKLFIRIPLIPTVNATMEEMKKLAKMVKELQNVVEVRVLPYHTFGQEKYTTLGYAEPKVFPTPDDQTLQMYQALFN